MIGNEFTPLRKCELGNIHLVNGEINTLKVNILVNENLYEKIPYVYTPQNFTLIIENLAMNIKSEISMFRFGFSPEKTLVDMFGVKQQDKKVYKRNDLISNYNYNNQNNIINDIITFVPVELSKEKLDSEKYISIYIKEYPNIKTQMDIDFLYVNPVIPSQSSSNNIPATYVIETSLSESKKELVVLNDEIVKQKDIVSTAEQKTVQLEQAIKETTQTKKDIETKYYIISAVVIVSLILIFMKGK